MRNAHLALTSKKTSAYSSRTKPSLWEQTLGSRPARLYITIIELETPQNHTRDIEPLALLTRTRLPDFPPFPLNLQIDKSSNVLCSSLPKDFSVSPSALDGLTDFTLRIYDDVYSKCYEKNESLMTYWLAPAAQGWKEQKSPEQVIDWTRVTYIQNIPSIPWTIATPHNQLVDRFLVDPGDGSRKFFSTAIEPNLRPHDPVPKDATTYRHMKSIIDYSVSLSRKRRAEARWVEDQPVIRAEKVVHRRNLLDEYTEKEKSVSTLAYLCPEPLKFSAVSTPPLNEIKTLTPIVPASGRHSLDGLSILGDHVPS